MRGLLKPWRVLGGIVVLLALTVMILLRIPSDKYILLPDIAHPVAPLVKVEGAHTPKGAGSVYFLDVIERKASELEALFPWIRSNATLVPAGDILPPCSTAREADAAQLQEMAFSQRVAATVALRKLGYHVVVRPTGVVVSQLIAGTNAPCKLQPMDIVEAVNGTTTPTISALHSALGRVTPGSVVALRVRRGGSTITVRVRTVAVPQDPSQALVGFAPEQGATFKLPIKISIDVGNVGGPSAGLAFALEVMQKLGRNVTHGLRVAATGEMELNGSVAPIGGVRQKVVDAHKADVQVMLVPAGDNAKEAKRYAKNLEVIPVRTFDQALRALTTLSRTR
ncbi:MAG TPA: S16 family serine protease [Gaiellaceae bacterium]|nr:S16 family serine protease [Gaiellaceae bacterium]